MKMSGRVQPDSLLEGRVSRLVEAEGGRLSPRAAVRVMARLRRAGFPADEVRAQVDPYLEFDDSGGWGSDEVE